MFKLFLILSILTTHPYTKDANIGVLICDYQTGDTIDAYRADAVIPPASTIKLLTTATILEIFGSDYQIQTPICYSGYIKDSTLYGNLYIEGRGDPTLGSRYVGDQQFLQKWTEEIRKAGIRHIKGDIIADASYFDLNATNPAWLWEDIGNYYAPGIAALSYMDNTMTFTLKSGICGSRAEVINTYPEAENMRFDSYVECANINYDGAYVHGIAFSNYRYLTGKIPSNRESFKIRGDMPNPPLALATDLYKHLTSNGVTVSGKATFIREKSTTSTYRKTLFVHHSETLSEIIRHTNHKSDNLYAEMLFRILAYRKGTPCTIKHSVSFIKEYWKKKGLVLDNARILDGCGLAPQDALSSSMLVDLLCYMYNSKHKEAFTASLPCSGESGTLKSFLRNTELQGKVCAKSGTIGGTKNFAGYIYLPDGRVWVFAIMVNSASCKASRIQSIIEEYLLDVYTRNT
jgi:D-alanyl-D-alanine carboxypeptidase/D-alanyl-D-alanine-endopeptidase (penicillin-binding protein 4)